MADAVDPKRAQARAAWRPGLEGLRAAQARSLTDLGTWWKTAEARASSKDVAQWAIAALETMSADDTISLGMRACDVLRRLGGADEAARLVAVRRQLPARVALRDWRLEADRAVAVMQARAAGRCTCAAEAAHGAPVYGPQWTVDSETVDPAQYAVVLDVRCACGQRWRVTRQEGYHYPISRWSRVDG